MRNESQYDVAVSYATEDVVFAQALVTALLQHGLRVFFDKGKKADLAGSHLPTDLADVFQNHALCCVILLSPHFLNKKWTKLELNAALEHAPGRQKHLLVVRLGDAQPPPNLADIGLVASPPETPASIADLILTKLGREVVWITVPIPNKESGGVWEQNWQDIAWIESPTDGWLCGAFEVGAGGGDVGRGILLYTKDGGSSWNRVGIGDFPSGQGTFSWGPRGTRMYAWSEIGPITTIRCYRRHLGKGQFRTEIWIAAATGVYCSEDGGYSWSRSTPGPDHPDRYAFFASLADIEGFSEIYAAGWQGIAHWSARSREWNLQLPSYFFNINSILAAGGSENRRVWAVGRSGIDEHGDRGDRSRGAVWQLDRETSNWSRIPLTGIELRPGQDLIDLWAQDSQTLFVVGAGSLILRGTQQADTSWKWERLEPPLEADFAAITYGLRAIWILGTQGTILKSPDFGVNWVDSSISTHTARPNLRRVRFFGEAGWIVGDKVVLKSVLKQTVEF